LLHWFSQRKNDREDILPREFDGYVTESCWHRNHIKLSLKESGVLARPGNACDGTDMVVKGEKLLKQLSQRQFPVLVSI
jgi:hypothetical protein